MSGEILSIAAVDLLSVPPLIFRLLRRKLVKMTLAGIDADIVVHLRYPTARETSAALLRVLAQGRATIVSDLEHQAGLPADAVVRVDVAREEAEVTREVLRLAGDPETRAALGRRAAAFVREEHSPDRVREAWDRALERTRERPLPPPRDWPPHWPRAGWGVDE
jgi:hypothetical protein